MTVLRRLSLVALAFALSQCGDFQQVFTPTPETSRDVAIKKSSHSKKDSVTRRESNATVDASGVRAPITTKQGSYYFIHSGDTLADIADKYSMDEQEIAQINNLQDEDMIVGRRLFIPNRRTKSQYLVVTQAILRSSDKDEKFKGEVKFAWPVEGITSSPFGWRHGRNHDGLDISAKVGTPIHAAEDGRVLFSKRFAGYGNLIVLKHGQDYFSAYAHATTLLVEQGDKVRKGQQIATVGNTGRSTGPHLHFEIRKNVQALDPASLLPPRSLVK